MCEPKILALGTFDGLHRGHMGVLQTAVQSGRKPYVLLFDQHPASVLRGETPPLLLTSEKRDALLRAAGLTPLTVSFSDIMALSPQAFFKTVLLKAFSASALCCGENYTFGKGGAGNVQTLRALCEQHNIPLFVAKTQIYKEKPISSTRIRAALQNGEIEAANAMLGRPFSYAFEVVEGDKRGREFQFPTINQFFPDTFVRPKFGVYASRTCVEGTFYPSVTNFGVRPTIGTQTVRSETHILGFSGDLYGTYPEVELLSFLRGEREFASFAELKAAIAADSRRAQEFYGNMLAKTARTM